MLLRNPEAQERWYYYSFLKRERGRGITPRNILRHETASRNRALAEAFQKLGYVERAGVGRRRIFKTVLEYGKRPPVYEDDGQRVTLRVYDGSFDQKMAELVASWKAEGAEIDLDGLLVLSYLRDHQEIDSAQAAEFLQTSRDDARAGLDVMARPKTGFLERLGHNRAATYRLAKGVAVALIGEAAYTKSKGINPIRYAEMVKAYLADHSEITPRQVRELLALGDSRSAQVEVSRLLARWTGDEGFLEHEGRTHRRRYRLRIVSKVVSEPREPAPTSPKAPK